MTSFSSIASFANLRADTVPTAPAPRSRTLTNSSFHCWRGTRSGPVGEPSACGTSPPPLMGAHSSRRSSAVRVDPPLGRRMQTYPPPKRGWYSAIVAPAPHPLSSPLVTLPRGRYVDRYLYVTRQLITQERVEGQRPEKGRCRPVQRVPRRAVPSYAPPQPTISSGSSPSALQLFQQRCDVSRHSAANRDSRTGQPGPSRAPGCRGSAGSAGSDSHRSGPCRGGGDHRCRREPPDRLCRWHRSGEHWTSPSRSGGRGSAPIGALRPRLFSGVNLRALRPTGRTAEPDNSGHPPEEDVPAQQRG